MSDNGILVKVPGQFVARGARMLPLPETIEAQEQVIEIDAGHVGRVMIFYQRKTAKHGKFSHQFWCAYRAEAIIPSAPADPT